MLEEMPSSIFLEWYDHYLLEPWGYTIDTIRHAQLSCYLVNGLYHPESLYKLEDFIPERNAEPVKEQTWQEMKAILKSRC